MQILSHLSLRKRIILAFFTLVAMMSLSTYLSINFFSDASREMRVMVEDQTRRAILAQRLGQSVQFATNQLLLLLQTQERTERIPLYQKMDKALLSSDAALRTLRKEINSEELNSLVDIKASYAERFQATVEEIEFNGLEAARTHFKAQTQPVLDQLLIETEKVSLSQQDGMIITENQYRAQNERLSMVILFIEIIVVVLGLLFSIRFARNLAQLFTNPIKIADQIASGDYEAKIPKTQTPELVLLLNALDKMRQGILGREQQIKRLAFKDSLTKLSSRLFFMQALRHAINEGTSSIILLDINRFSQINTALGHSLGDHVLEQVAQRLMKVVSVQHTLARLEANRFAILSPHDTTEEMQSILRDIHLAFEAPIEVDKGSIYIDLRAALAQAPEHGENAEDILRSAEFALQRAKHSRSAVVEAIQKIEPSEEHSLSMLEDLRKALSKGEFKLVYQPKWDPKIQQITGVEALVRWVHPTRGFIAPDNFIPFAEQTGFIRKLTPWVLATAIAATARWYSKGYKLVVAVNLSTLDLDNPELVSEIESMLTKANLPPEYICLEVTESALMIDPDAGRICLERLRALGLKLAIDDYGTGQASLAYVRDLPVQELKIDRSFITNIHKHKRNAAIVRSTLQLCQELGITQVAEGVELKEELDWLEQAQCSLIQGYYISRPVDEAQIDELVTSKLL